MMHLWHGLELRNAGTRRSKALDAQPINGRVRLVHEDHLDVVHVGKLMDLVRRFRLALRDEADGRADLSRRAVAATRARNSSPAAPT